MRDVQLFLNGSVHEFYHLKVLITLEQVITSMVEKKKNINEPNVDDEANWLGVMNFHCMQISLVMSVQFSFGDD